MQIDLEFVALKSEPVLLAVSGGSDSMALLQVTIAAGFEKLSVVTVDHGLREEAKNEAEFVKTICEKHNLMHHTIKVEVDRSGNLQSQARNARYQALIEHCKTNEIKHVFLGHTADDQAETFLLRAFRGSGVDGLAGMSSKRMQEGITFWRPLLDEWREDLRIVLRENNWSWIDDPSNVDESFDRVKIRKLLSDASKMGFESRGLLQSASNMARTRDTLNPIAQNFVQQHITTLPLDIEDHIDPMAFADLPISIATKILGDLCKKFGYSKYVPRRDGIDRLYEMILNHKEGGMAIGHTDFHWSQNRIRVCAEFNGLPKNTDHNIWHRWTIDQPPNTTIGAIGERIGEFNFWREFGISHRAAISLPALFNGDEIIHVHGVLHENFNFEIKK